MLGAIGGPDSPKDLNSFLLPFRDEMVRLGTSGVTALDAVEGMQPFRLRGYLGYFHGDMPAIADVMNSRGHNSKHACRVCRIKGVSIPRSIQSRSCNNGTSYNTHNYFCHIVPPSILQSTPRVSRRSEY